MNCCNAYENDVMKEMTGETLRPGGFSLTEKGVEFCEISADDEVLDLGCGRGATVNYLLKNHQISAMGIDASEKLIKAAKETYENADFFLGRGEALPFSDQRFDSVFAECTLSLMEDADSVIKQVYRVLKDDGWFVITDVYARNPDALDEMKQFDYHACLRGLHDLKELERMLQRSGFTIELFEDYSQMLKELLVKIGFRYGSMAAFWNAASQECVDGCQFQAALKLCKPGYFMIVARKKQQTKMNEMDERIRQNERGHLQESEK